MARPRKTRRRDWRRDATRIVEQYHQSGLSRRSFAESVGMPVSTLGYWVRKSKKPQAETAHLIPVRWAPVESSRALLEVVLPNERVVRVCGDVDAELLAKVLSVVDPSC